MFSTIQFCIYVIIVGACKYQIANMKMTQEEYLNVISVFIAQIEMSENGQVIQQLCGLTKVFHTLTRSS